jgi:hypothetical protein
MNDFEDSQQEKELKKYIVEGLNSEVKEERTRLSGLENRVLNKLRGKSNERDYVPSFFRYFPSPKLALVTSLAIVLVAGLVAGFFIGGFVTPISSSTRGFTFVIAYPEAQRVELAGDFTNWQPRRLKKRSGGIWAIKLDLEPGRYEYNFIINDDRWVPDPRAAEYVRSYDNLSSVIYVDDGRQGSGSV